MSHQWKQLLVISSKPGAAGDRAHPYQLCQREPHPGQAQRALEFLGDSVLQIVSADYLFHAYATGRRAT